MKNILIKYHDIKSLLTLDMQFLFHTIMRLEGMEVTFKEMNSYEKQQSEQVCEFEILKITNRFMLFDRDTGERNKELEKYIVDFGQK